MTGQYLKNAQQNALQARITKGDLENNLGKEQRLINDIFRKQI